MEIYNFKCKNCGSSKYKRIGENIFECEYCGYREQILDPSGKDRPHDREEPKESYDIDSNSQQDTDEEVLDLDDNPEPIEETHEEEQINKKSVSSAICSFLLVLLFGWLGIQHMAQGRIGLGILYMFTYGLFFIGWVIDDIRYFNDLVLVIKDSIGGKHD